MQSLNLDASKDTRIVDVHPTRPVILGILVDHLLNFRHHTSLLILLLLLGGDFIVLSSDFLSRVGTAHTTHHDWEAAWGAHDLERGAWGGHVHAWGWGCAPADGGCWGGDLRLWVDLGGEAGVGVDHLCGCVGTRVVVRIWLLAETELECVM